MLKMFRYFRKKEWLMAVSYTHLTSQPQTVDYTFTMKQETDPMAKLCFNCGNEDEELPEHTIYLDNVSLELIDDSKVNYGTSDADAPSIAINQVGYKPESETIAIFRNVTDEKGFSVVNADTKETVYTGELYGEKKNFTADETNWFGDFSKVTSPGKYYIKCGNLKDSYTFEIGNNVYTLSLIHIYFTFVCKMRYTVFTV